MVVGNVLAWCIIHRKTLPGFMEVFYVGLCCQCEELGLIDDAGAATYYPRLAIAVIRQVLVPRYPGSLSTKKKEPR